jgi:hypothetical protein
MRWEVYSTREQAVDALSECWLLRGADGGPIDASEVPLLRVAQSENVTCVQYDCALWYSRYDAVSPQLRCLVENFGRHRIVLDFADQPYITTLAMASLYALHRALERVGGRLAFCNLCSALRDFFSWHNPDQIAFPSDLPAEEKP